MTSYIVSTRRRWTEFDDQQTAESDAVDRGCSAILAYTPGHRWEVTEIDARSYVLSDMIIAAWHGIWTPQADVLCLRCHGAFYRGSNGRRIENWLLRSRTQELAERYEVFKCDCCGEPTFIQDDTASELASLRDAIGRGRMEQTGGMCAALAVDDLMIFASDELEGRFSVARAGRMEGGQDLTREQILTKFRV